MQLPCVSAIVPLFNGAAYVAEALRSIVAQDYRPLEVIVVDDGSTDGGAAVVRDFADVRYLYQHNAGVAAARNTGLDAARGELVAFLDQDDWWLPGKLRAQVGRLQERPELDFVLAQYRVVLEPGVRRPFWLPEALLGLDQPTIVPGVVVARPGAYDLVGRYDSSYVTSSDAEWVYRAKDLGAAYEIMPLTVLCQRIHRTNASHDRPTCRREIFRALRQSVLRQRALAARRDR